MKWHYFNNRFFWSIIILGLIIRLILALLPGFTFDMNYWVNWTQRLNQVGLINFYTSSERTDYMPGYLYILYLLGFAKNHFYLNESTFFYILKLPGIIGEFFLTAVVYLILLKSNGLKIARLGAMAIWLNPVIIFNSAIWGQIDGLLTLFLALSIFSLNISRLFLAGIFLGISILIKPQALAIIPALLLYLIKNSKLIDCLKIFSSTFLIIIIFSIPFFGILVFSDLLMHLKNTASEYPYSSLSAYNLWGIVGFWIEDSRNLLGFTYQTWGIFLYFSFWIVVTFLYIKKKYSLYSLVSLATLSFYFLPTRVHERYLYPALVFLFISSFLLKNRLLIALAVCLSIIHFINLLYVYLRYNGHLLNFMSYLKPIYHFLEKNITLLSLISVTFFVIILITLLKTNYDKKIV